MKLLILDLETAPNLAHVWQLYDQNISLSQIIEDDYILSWAAKWLGENEIFYASRQKSSSKKMLAKMYKLLEEADAVIHYNGKRFDIPWLNREFLLNGWTPPSPYKQIDLYQTVKSTFRFPSNKLDYVASRLGLGSKIKHTGHELWVRCIEKDPVAWEMMQEYNIQDVLLTEKVYNKLLPWIKGHPNHSTMAEDSFVCPNCGGTHLQKRGYAHTLSSTYQRFKCLSCGHWSKDTKILNRNAYKLTSVQ